MNSKTLCLVFLMIAGAWAGVTLVNSSQSLKEKGTPRTHTIYLDKNMARMELNGEEKYFIYRADKNLFWIVDKVKKSYIEMTRTEIETLSSSMTDAIAMMQSQLKNLSPDQRKKIEELLRTQMQPPITYKQTAGGEIVNGWTCNKYSGTLNGLAQSEIWTADPVALDIPAEEYAVLKDMASLFQKFAGNLKGFLPVPDEKGVLSGMPVRTVIFLGGQPDWESDLMETKKGDFVPSLFEVPAGMMKKAFVK
jgi:hypothetical protein